MLLEGSTDECKALGEAFDAFEAADTKSDLPGPGTGSHAIPPPPRRTSAPQR